MQRACGATALVSLWRPGEDAAALREGAVYAVAGLVPKNKSRGPRLELIASSGTAWQPTGGLGDRRVAPGSLCSKQSIPCLLWASV